MKRVIVVTSGKGGVGKTTCVVNIGTALARLGNRVLLIDGDVGLRNLDLALGVADQVVYDFADVLSGNIRAGDAVIPCEAFNLYMIAAPQLTTATELAENDMRAVCNLFVPSFDYILIDCPAGIGRGFESAIAPADLALVVTTGDAVAMRDADRAIGLLERAGVPQSMLLINKVRGDLVRKGKTLNIGEVIEMIGIDAIGIVPEDSKVLEGTAFDELQYAGKAFTNIARRIEGEAVPLIKLKRRRV